jgi:hypothetical protein
MAVSPFGAHDGLASRPNESALRRLRLQDKFIKFNTLQLSAEVYPIIRNFPNQRFPEN